MSNTMDTFTMQQTRNTRLVQSDFQVDTDILRFSKSIPESTIPAKRRMLRVYMPQEVEPLVFTDMDMLTLGREGEGHNVLNLSLQYARLLGVSRVHAQILYTDDTYYLQDMGSSNGTYLNGRKLIPHRRYPLATGAEIRMGHLMMVVAFN